MTDTRQDFLHDLNTALGIPDARRKVVGKVLLAWWQSEGGATKGLPRAGWETDFNPFNTTLRVQGHSHDQPGNTVPVQVYDSRGVGLAATAETLSLPRYAPIIKAMKRKGVKARTIANRIIESDWGTAPHPFLDVLDDINRGLWDSYARIPVYRQT